MAYTLYFNTNGLIGGVPSGDQITNLASTAVWWTEYFLTSARGPGVSTATTTSVAGPTSGIEVGLPVLHWSPPLASSVTISGSVSFNLWGSESSMSANAGIGAVLYRWNCTTGAITTIGNGYNSTTELGTSSAVRTGSFTPTSTAFNEGDRIGSTAYFDDVGTMASGYTLTFYFGAASAGVSGDSYITLTETPSFDETAPSTQNLFFTTTQAISVTQLEAWTSRGSGVATDTASITIGPMSPAYVSNMWYTKPLQATTLSGPILVVLRRKQSLSSTNATTYIELALVDGDGTNPTVIGVGGDWTECSTVEGSRSHYLSGNSISVSNGQRLRFKIGFDDAGTTNGAAGGGTGTFYYAGAAGATGDSYITLPQTLTEYVAPPSYPFKNKQVRQLLAG